jgi:hypothetical protein
VDEAAVQGPHKADPDHSSAAVLRNEDKDIFVPWAWAAYEIAHHAAIKLSRIG